MMLYYHYGAIGIEKNMYDCTFIAARSRSYKIIIDDCTI